MGLKHLLERVPCQLGTLNARRHVSDVVQNVGVFQLVKHGLVGLFSANHAFEEFAKLNGLFWGAVNHQIAHNIGRCLRDCASAAHKSSLGNFAALYAHGKRELIATRRVNALVGDGWIIHLVFVIGVRNVVHKLSVIQVVCCHLFQLLVLFVTDRAAKDLPYLVKTLDELVNVVFIVVERNGCAAGAGLVQLNQKRLGAVMTSANANVIHV